MKNLKLNAKVQKLNWNPEANSEKKAGIFQSFGDRFATWKFRVETQLAAQGVRDIITADPLADAATEDVKKGFCEKDDRAVTFIADRHLEYVRDKPMKN